MRMGDSSSTTRSLRRRDRRRWYQLRLLGCVAAALALLIAAVHLWPVAPVRRAHPHHFATHGSVELREITPTRHARRTAPPPPPPPVPLVTVDAPIEQEPLDLTVELAPDRSAQKAPPGPKSLQDGSAKSSEAAAPDVGARVLRIAELQYTEKARREDIRARIRVEVVIASTGRVQEARIVGRALLPNEDETGARPVSVVGYGLEEAAIEAAQRTLFRPAQHRGQAVSSRKQLTFTFEPGS